MGTGITAPPSRPGPSTSDKIRTLHFNSDTDSSDDYFDGTRVGNEEVSDNIVYSIKSFGLMAKMQPLIHALAMLVCYHPICGGCSPVYLTHLIHGGMSTVLYAEHGGC